MITSQKFSNFRVTKTIVPPKYLFNLDKDYENEVIADVSVETTYFWFFKRKKTIEVYKEPMCFNWRYSDTGEYTPGRAIENLHYIALRAEAA